MTSANPIVPADPWLPSGRRASSDAVRVRLFCLPHAGAGASSYNLWKRFLPESIKVCPIQIPGREVRLSEASCTDSETLIEGMALGIASQLDRPYAIFGHSMGALLAFDLAQRLRAQGLRSPSYLFVSGRNATHVPMQHGAIHQLPDTEFLDALAMRYGGLPQEILDTPDLIDLYLPILRADLTLLETHRYRRLPALDCPIAAFSGEDDANVSAEGLMAWAEDTSGGFEARWFEGGHFYLSGASRVPLLELIGDRLAAVVRASSNG